MVACPTTRSREHRLISFMGLINDHDPRSETKPWIVSCLEIGISFQNWRLWLVRVGPDISSRQFNCFCGGLCVGMLDLVIRQRKKGFSRSFKLVVFREAIMEDFEGKISDCSIWDLVERFTFRYKLNNSNSNDVTKAVNTNQLIYIISSGSTFQGDMRNCQGYVLIHDDHFPDFERHLQRIILSLLSLSQRGFLHPYGIFGL